MINLIKVFDCFAGYGGAEFALKKAKIDFECIGFSEIDKYAIQCYKQNHEGKNFGDITKIKWNEVPDFDLLTGGFPCQDVSLAGKGNIKTGRTALGMELIKALEIKQPKFFLFENIKTLKNKEGKEFFLEFENKLKDLDYYFKKLVLISSDFGSPQQRERIYWCGRRKDLGNLELNLLNKQNKLVLADVIYKNYKGERIFKVLNPLKGKSLFGWHYEQGVYDFKGLTRALKSSSGSGNIPKVLDSEGNIRKLSGKECFRLMGFYDDEINLDGLSETRQRMLAGNGWEINTVSIIFKELIKEN